MINLCSKLLCNAKKIKRIALLNNRHSIVLCHKKSRINLFPVFVLENILRIHNK